MVGSILETLNGLSLEHLIRLGELCDTLLISVRNLRKPLSITRLSGLSKPASCGPLLGSST